MSPVLSVIIPVYNVELYLDECIESVLTQTFKDIEVILIDDGSTDSSGHKCDAWANKDSCIKVFHKSNEGLSSARNLGLERCQGEYVIFLDSDDKWETPHFLQQLVDLISVDSGLDFVQFNVKSFSDIKKVTDFRIVYESKYYSGNYDIFMLFLRDGISRICCDKIFRKSSIPAGVRFPYGVYYEDEHFILDLLPYLKKILISSVGSYLYRIHEFSITHQSFSLRHAKDLFKKDFHGLEFASKYPYLNELFIKYYANSLREYMNVQIISNRSELADYTARLRNLAPSWSQLLHYREMSMTEKTITALIKLLGFAPLNMMLCIKRIVCQGVMASIA